MAQQIAAVFNSWETSSSATARLQSEGFSAGLERLESPRLRSQEAASQTDTEAGQWVVTVHAPFGSARRAMAILAEFDPVQIAEHDAAYPSPTSYHAGDAGAEAGIVRSEDQSFFVSSILGLPLLINCPAPLSSLLRLPTLIRNEAPRFPASDG